MAHSHSIKVSHLRANEELQATVTKSAGQEVTISEAIADSTSPTITLNLDQSAMKLLYMNSTKDVTAVAGSDTITCNANEPVVWWEGGEFANPFTGDTTTIVVTNASGAEAQFELRALQDPTP